MTSLKGGFAYIGLDSIIPEMAKVLSEWETYFLCFPRLQSLSFESARYVGSAKCAHGLDFSLPLELDALAAKAAVCNGPPMHLALQAVPDIDCARALATHEHEIFLALPEEDVSSAVASALSFHGGYLLQLLMPNRPPESVLQALTSNSKKSHSVRSPNELNAQILGASHTNWLITLRDTDVKGSA